MKTVLNMLKGWGEVAAEGKRKLEMYFSHLCPHGRCVFSSQLSLTIGNQGSAGLSNPPIDWDNTLRAEATFSRYELAKM